MNVNVVSLLPKEAHDRLVRMLNDGVAGSFTLHIAPGSIKGFEVRETQSVK